MARRVVMAQSHVDVTMLVLFYTTSQITVVPGSSLQPTNHFYCDVIAKQLGKNIRKIHTWEN